MLAALIAPTLGLAISQQQSTATTALASRLAFPTGPESNLQLMITCYDCQLMCKLYKSSCAFVCKFNLFVKTGLLRLLSSYYPQLLQ